MFHEDSISTSEDIYKPNDTEKLGCYSNGDPPMECVLVSLELFQDKIYIPSPGLNFNFSHVAENGQGMKSL